MRRFFINKKDYNLDTIKIDGEEFHHLKNVCRLTEGERIELLDGNGHIAIGEITIMGKKDAQVKVLTRNSLAPFKRPIIHLFLSIPKFQTMDVIIQKMVELGVKEVTPILSERSFIKKKSVDLAKKIQRWLKISLQACKQSGRPWPLVVHEPLYLKDALGNITAENTLFLYEGEGAIDIKGALDLFWAPEAINVFVGSEGGFSPEEVELFQSKGIKPVTIGDLVLRVETACIAVCSVIKYHFNLLRG